MAALACRPLLLSVAMTLGLTACSGSTPHNSSGAATAAITLDETTLPPQPRFHVGDLDPAVAACSQLADHVNAKWLAANPVPADRATWGSLDMLAERSLATQRQLAERAAALPNAQGIDKLIGDLWSTGMDAAAINAAGITPIQPEIERIAALAGADDIADYLRESFARGEGLLFSFGPEADFADATQTIAYAGQGGLGLPHRDFYLGEHEDHLHARGGYKKHIAAMLVLAGLAAEQATMQASAVLALETRLAKASMSNEELARDVSKHYNPVSVADADLLTPAFPWSRFFESQGLAAPAMFSLAQPDFHRTVNAMLTEVPVADWQAYLLFHTLDKAAPFLSDAFAEQHYRFHGKTLRGQQAMPPRWKRVLDAINGSAGEAMGELYVQHAFAEESKAALQQLVDNLAAALRARLETLAWMDAGTRGKALEKLAGLRTRIGHPEVWRDWSGLITSRDSYFANLVALHCFNRQFALGRIGKPVDPNAWQTAAQRVHVHYHPQKNTLLVPAAILQPPLFDPDADVALNYGGIGALIGHAMIHGYDDQGSRFDAHGNFADGWTEQDRHAFAQRTGKLVLQFDAYTAINDLQVNGTLTLGENVADLGGLALAYSALQTALAAPGVPRAAIDGHSPEQRFFYSWATLWRRSYQPEALQLSLSIDAHAPAMYRAIGAPSNMPEFAAAFGCKEGDAMRRADAERVAIW